MLEEIRHKIKSLLNENDQSITDTDRLVTSGRLNSLNIIELATWLENKYGINFSETGFNIYDFETVLTIMELVKNKKR